MFSTRRVVLAVALLAAAPAASLAAQTGAPAHPREHAQGQQQRGGPRNPVARLLEKRAELGLTDRQVTQITAIQAELDRQNQPLMRQMQAFRGPGRDGQRPSEADREAMRQRREQARPVMERMRQNNQAAMERVQALLTAGQKEKVRATLRDGRGEGRGHRGGGENGPRARSR
jgi:Spy/CpxP family protein refolding chaperone